MPALKQSAIDYLLRSADDRMARADARLKAAQASASAERTGELAKARLEWSRARRHVLDTREELRAVAAEG